MDTNFYDYVAAPLSLLSAFICGIAVISSYIYPQQRKFPNVVLVWTCFGDFIFALYVAIIWLPGPARNYFVEQLPHNQDLCTLSLYSMLAMQESSSVLGLLLACTLYINVVQRIDMEQGNGYYYGFIASFWIPTLLLPCLCLIETTHVVEVGFCALKSKIGIAIRIGNWALLESIQIFLIIKVVYVVYSVRSAIPKNSHNPDPAHTYFWLFVRCVGAMFNQITVWLPTTVTEVMALDDVQPALAFVLFCAATPVFLSANGIIVLLGNKPLRTALHNFFTNCTKEAITGTELMRVASFSASNSTNYV